MTSASLHGRAGDRLEVLCKDGERVLCREWRMGAGGSHTMLAVRPTSEHPAPSSLDRLAREYALRDELDGAWAARPQELVCDEGRTMLLLEDPGGEPLDRLLGSPMKMENALGVAIGITAALGKVHQRGLIHKDIKPANILVNRANGKVWLTGFGITSRLPRERHAPDPPEIIAGTLAYMAPEQTGRMNRSIDARSDLYALGVTLYKMLTGSLPFTASEPMEWVHCHIARKPVPPAERVRTIPPPVSALVMKLLAKTAEERYQTAAGLESDLRRCRADWERKGYIASFQLGEHDTPDRVIIPEKLYGREREIHSLLAAFDRVVTSGAAELVLVSGYSGIGKSSVVNELHKVLVPPRGLFASGKFDQYKRDIPYATLAQAFQSLIRPLLGKSEDELNRWRSALGAALGPNARLIADLVPELKLIIGEQPPVPDLQPQDAQRRFQLVFRRFIGVFARPEHPLALFLDDLQWLDAATLDLLEDLLSQRDVHHLMLIGAYRDNEVGATHPLRHKLDAIRQTGASIQEITLAPLARKDLGQLLADSLRCRAGRTAELAQLVYQKTAGNPFFAIQFISELAEEGSLAFDHANGCWCWNLDRIHAKGYAENVVDLMVRKLHRLPAATQKALQQLTCLGNAAAIQTLRLVHGTSEEELHVDLWEAVRQELVIRLSGSYRVIHDRVQEAAYSLIPDELRAQAHLRIGRLLVAHTPAEEREEAIFEIVGQLNRGAALITAREEREQLAAFNLAAGKRAKAATAYASALAYLSAGAALLDEDRWERQHELAFALEINRAECEFLSGDLKAAEERLAALSACAADTVERAAIACLSVDLYTTLDRSDRAIAVCLDYLRHLGIEWSPHPAEEDARSEYERIWSLLGSRTVSSLIDLPLMNDPASLATLDVLIRAWPAALFTDANLHSLIICRAVNLSIEGGNCAGSSIAYIAFGMLAGPHFGNYRAGFQFGRLGYELVERRGLQGFEARTYLCFGGHITPWSRHIRTGRDLVRRAFESADKTGDLTFAVYSCNVMITHLLAGGDPLIDVQREAEHDIAFVQGARFGAGVDIIATQLGLIRTLRGLTPRFGCFDDRGFDELSFERHVSSNPALAIAECWYWIRKLQARFLAGDYASAVEASLQAERLLWTSPSFFEVAEYHFFSALARAAAIASGRDSMRGQHIEALSRHHRQLEIWAQNCPDNFENRAALAAAEIARIEARDIDAMHFYEEAIRSASANGFVQNEALANELAGRFYLDRGLEKNGHAHLRDARACYELWGAEGKVRQLDQLYPRLTLPERHGSAATTGSPLQQLDAASVVRASQALSSQIVLPKLIEQLMTITLENAGANRGLLILPAGDDFAIRAEAKASGVGIDVVLCQQPIMTCPETLIRYVIRTHERIILDDASKPNLFSEDEHLRSRSTRSILGLPLLKQGRLIGLLYLENTLTSHAFTPDRVALLEVLAAQAAISLENTGLYSDLQEREAKIRRLVDANIIGIFIWDFDGQIIEANDAFLNIVGYDRDDLVSGRVRWTDLTPPEWHEPDERNVLEIKRTGALQPFEKEFFHKGGGRVPVLLGAATFGGGGHQGVAFVLDLTERNRAVAAARESERRYAEVQVELAHANRIAMMGQLTASIAHEVNQPIAATVTNAEAGLRWLGAQPPNLEEARLAFHRVVRDGYRAGDVVRRIRDLVKKTPPREDVWEVNEAIIEVIALTRAETIRNGVCVQTQLAEGLPLIQGDRVQLQQVMLNLIMNAVEAMSGIDAGPRELLISTGMDSDDVLVAVQDTGPGLSPDSIERIFDAFYTTKPHGMGMGLSICRSIVEAHGGRLWAAADLSQGAAFHVTLPVAVVRACGRHG